MRNSSSPRALTASYFGIEGAARWALPLYTLRDARALTSNALLSLLEAADAHPDRYADGAGVEHRHTLEAAPPESNSAGAIVELLDILGTPRCASHRSRPDERHPARRRRPPLTGVFQDVQSLRLRRGHQGGASTSVAKLHRQQGRRAPCPFRRWLFASCRPRHLERAA